MIGTTDETQVVIDLLTDNWDTGVIAQPTIAKKENYDYVDVANGNFVLGYPISRNITPLDSARRYHKVNVQVALDIRTDDESDHKLIENEIKRICKLKRHDVTYFDSIFYLGIEAVLNYRKLFRTVHTVELRNSADSAVA